MKALRLSSMVVAVSLLVWIGFAAVGLEKNELLIVETTYLTRMDPQDNVQMTGYYLLPCYEGLVRFKVQEDAEIEPCLAASWEISADSTVYTFHIRQNVLFHDGTALDANAVKVSFDRAVSKQLATSAYISTVTNPEEEGAVGEPLGTVEVVDPATIRITLRGVLPTFLMKLALFPIVSPKPVTENPTDLGAEWYKNNIDGTGPYTLDYWKAPAELGLKRFDGYWGGWEGKHLDKVVFLTIEQLQTGEQMLLAGDCDINRSTLQDSQAALRKNPNIVLAFPGSPYSLFTIAFNTKKWPTADILVRKAISLCYNAAAAISLLGGPPNAMGFNGPVAATNQYYNKALPVPEYNLDKAKELLQQAGYPGGKGLPAFELPWSQHVVAEDVASQVLKSECAKVGITVNPVAMGFATMLDMGKSWKTCDNLTFISSYPAFDPVPDQLMQFMYHTGGVYNWNFFSSTPDGANIDAMIDQATTEPNDTIRAALYNQLQEIAVSNYLAIWAIANAVPAALRANVKGFVTMNAYYVHFPVYNMWKE